MNFNHAKLNTLIKTKKPYSIGYNNYNKFIKRRTIYEENLCIRRNFDQKWRQYGLSSEEFRELELQLLMDPKQGDVITGTGGLRKVRFSPEREQQGKSGAYRIIYLDIQLSSHTVLLLIYAKNQQADLKPNQKKVLKQLVEQLKSLYSSERVNGND